MDASKINMLYLCKPGTENLLTAELSLHGNTVAMRNCGWLTAEDCDGLEREKSDLCFAHTSILQPCELRASSVNALSAKLCDFFGSIKRGQPITEPWPLVFQAAPHENLQQRLAAVQRQWTKQMRRRMARVMDLSAHWHGDMQWQQGFFVFCADFDCLFAADSFRGGGQQRMKFDPAAPSRSYLKAEEAYRILGHEPSCNETVADLGAAPGGWSYSAAKRGAAVWAVDNGPLKKGAHEHPRIRHVRQDAFSFQPDKQRFDWLFCDIIDDPYRTLELLQKWLSQTWCRFFIVNLKYGRFDPIALLQQLQSSAVMDRYCDKWHARHLYHDREEITVVGRRR